MNPITVEFGVTDHSNLQDSKYLELYLQDFASIQMEKQGDERTHMFRHV